MSGWAIVVVTKVTVLLLAVAVAMQLLRRRAAAVRHLLWVTGLGGALVLPWLECAPGVELLPSWSGTPAVGWPAAAAKPRPAAPEPGADRPDPVAPARGPAPLSVAGPGNRKVEEDPVRVAGPIAAPSSPGPGGPRAVAAVLAAIWSAGVLLLLGRVARGWLCLRRLRSAAVVDGDPPAAAVLAEVRLQLRVGRRIALLRSAGSAGPMTWGVLRPVIVLPGDADRWSPDRLRSVLLHEVAHVARMDAVWQLLGRIARAVYWFHPLAWLAMRGLHREQERACDDVVLAAGTRPSGYAEDLMGVAEALRPLPAASLVSTAIARPGELVSRMGYLLDANQDRRPLTRAHRLGAVVPALFAACLLGASRPVPAPPPGAVEARDGVATPLHQDKPGTRAGRGGSSDGEKAKLAARLTGMLDLDTHRDQAIRELAELGAPALPALQEAAAEPQEVVANGAITALGKSVAPPERVAPILLQVLADTERPKSSRLLAARSLGPRVDTSDEVFAAFMAILDESSDQDLTVEVVHHLSGSIKRRGAVAKALTRMKRGVSVEEPQRRVETLIGALCSRFLREGAIRDLRAIGEPAVPGLIAALRDPEPEVRKAVLDLLVVPRPVNKEVGHHLVSLITGADERFARIPGEYLLACLKHDPDLVDRVLRIVQDGSQPRQEILAGALACLQDPEVTARLIGLLKAAPGPVAMAIVRGFGRQFQDATRREALTVAFEHPDPEVVETALEVLLGDPAAAAKARTAVERLVGHRSHRVRVARQRFLQVLGERSHFVIPRFLVCDYSSNRVVQFGPDGKQEFAIEDRFGVWDAERLANGNLLITEFSVNRVCELTRDGKPVWSFEDLKNPYDADRLPNGNTLIADTFGRRVIEVDPRGAIVWKYTGVRPYDVDRLPNGNTLIADPQGDRVIEVDRAGKILWKIENVPNVHDADRLPNGNTLLTIRMLNEVREVDPLGRTVWARKGLSSPSDADRLPDGNTLVAENGFVRIFAPSGAELFRTAVTWAVEVNVVDGR